MGLHRDPISKVCYILTLFPAPSETFISDEAASMLDLGVTPYILSLSDGDTKIIHPSARRILDAGLFQTIQTSSRLQRLNALFHLFLLRPRETFGYFFKALHAPDRWMHFQAVPYALFLVKKKVQFIHAHFASDNLNWAKALSEWAGIPFGVTTHRYDLLKDPIPPQTASALFHQADLIVTISKFNQTTMTEKYDLPADKIKIIHCGIDLRRFTRTAGTKKFTTPKLRIVNVGRLVPEKGQDVLIRALEKAKERGVRFELKIIGSGPLLNDLTALTQSLGLEDQVAFLGAQPQETVIKHLQDSDIFILSSRSEGIPVVCMEAMAMEVFLIATRISGIPELVKDKENGLLVEPEDVQGLADALYWTDSNRDLLGEMCRSARQKIDADFNRNKCTRSLLAEMEKHS